MKRTKNRPMGITVEFWMKGKSKECKTFDTFKKALIFCHALSINSSCEAYGVVWDR